MSTTPRTPPRRAWVVWGVGVLAYIVAVFHRSSLGVAGLEAADRFGVSATTLATFSMVQLLVYAAMQVPVGVLLDRLGSRRLLLTGAVLMAAGQLLFAVAGTVPLALLARVLIGSGDAMTFVSVLRLVALWFPPRRNPVVLQLTGLLGQLGAILSAAPMVRLLHGVGWQPAFALAAGVGAVAALLVAAVLRDAPPGAAPPVSGRLPRLPDVRRELRLAWHEPGTRLGLWTHFTTQFPATVFLLLWGFPFLVDGEGLAPATAGLLLTTLTIAGMVCGPMLGGLVGRYPFHRSSLALAIVAATAVVWAVVLLWPGPAPLAMLLLLVLVMGANGPGSMIGFDFARTFNPAPRLGSATGIVNVGGFAASLITVVLVGAILDAVGPAGGGQDLAAFRWAFAVQYLMWGIGAGQIWRYRRRARRSLAERDPEAYAALRRGEIVTG